MLTIFRIAALLAVLATPAFAETGTLTVAGFAGSFETTLRGEVIPAFEKKAGVRVDYIGGSSRETLARLQQGQDPPIDVVIADQAAIVRAITLGFCGRIDGLPTGDLLPATRLTDDKAVALGLAGTGLMYNAGLFAAKGWSPPRSWNDLKDPRYRKLVVLPRVEDVYGLEMLVMLARANGGGEANIEPGFKALREGVGPNVLADQASPSKIGELFSSGEAALAAWGSGRAQYLANGGTKVGFVYPAEGTPAAFPAACPTAKIDRNGPASAFVAALLQPGLQRLLFRDYGYAPANRTVELPTERAAIAPSGERAATLLTLDWKTIDAHRGEWTARSKRELGQ